MFDDIFNAQILDSSNINSNDEFIDSILPKLEEILNFRFSDNKYKRNIRIRGNNRINFACPLCGDSHSDNSKKRGNIILEPGEFQYTYKCFNCGAYMPLKEFFNKFNSTLDLSTIEYISKAKSDFSYIKKSDSSAYLLFDIDYIDSFAIDREYLKTKLNLIDVTKDNSAGKYLIARNQYNFDRFLYDNYNNIIYILNLTSTGKILGIQTRVMNSVYNGPKYKTYKLSNIYSMMLHEEREISNDLDTLSMFFNILLVNYNKNIIVVEGPLDSFLINNCIATCGATKSIPIEFNFYYLYDDDKTGRKKAFEKLNNKHYVFLWDKFKNDLMLPKKDKWDFNDVINYCKINNKKVPNILEYFSNDEFDLIDI